MRNSKYTLGKGLEEALIQAHDSVSEDAKRRPVEEAKVQAKEQMATGLQIHTGDQRDRQMTADEVASTAERKPN